MIFIAYVLCQISLYHIVLGNDSLLMFSCHTEPQKSIQEIARALVGSVISVKVWGSLPMTHVYSFFLFDDGK